MSSSASSFVLFLVIFVLLILTFGLGLETSLQGAVSKQVRDILKKVILAPVVTDFALSGRVDGHNQVVDGIEVILVSQVSSWKVFFLGWVPLSWEKKRVAISLVWSEAGEVSGLSSEDVGGLTVSSEGWSGVSCQDRGSCEETKSSTTRDGRLVDLTLVLIGSRSDGNTSACCNRS